MTFPAGRLASALVAGSLVLMSAMADAGGAVSTVQTSASPAAAAPAVQRAGQGYWLVAADGGIFTFGDAPFYGSLGGTRLNAPIVGGSPTTARDGYWLLGQDGGIFSFGNAPFEDAAFVDAVGMTGGTNGYAIVDRTGGITNLGGARTYPNGPSLAPAASFVPGPARVLSPYVGISRYWTATADGGVFSLFNAPFFGSLGGVRLNAPIVGIAATPTGNGYWLVAADGGVFAFGDAQFFGSTGGQHLNKPVVGMAPTPSGNGYWLVASDGGVFAFGDAQFLGSRGGAPLNQPIVALLA